MHLLCKYKIRTVLPRLLQTAITTEYKLTFTKTYVDIKSSIAAVNCGKQNDLFLGIYKSKVLNNEM